jgi:hypothetical protein
LEESTRWLVGRGVLEDYLRGGESRMAWMKRRKREELPAWKEIFNAAQVKRVEQCVLDTGRLVVGNLHHVIGKLLS